MKKTVIVILLLALSLSLFSCADPSAPAADVTTDEQTVTESETVTETETDAATRDGRGDRIHRRTDI